MLAVDVPIAKDDVVADIPENGCVHASYDVRDPVIVRLEPMTNDPAPQEAVPVHVMVPVATFAKVLTPEKYGMFPIVGADDVERPTNVRFGVRPPDDWIGNEPVTAVTADVINPASLLNHESRTDDEAMVWVKPFVPV